MLEGVLKDSLLPLGLRTLEVSILGMLEGVLKGEYVRFWTVNETSFNPWYVGGGVKRVVWRAHHRYST